MLKTLSLLFQMSSSACTRKYDHSNASQMIGLRYQSGQSACNEMVVTKEMLPENHRVLPKGSIWTMDYQPERMNVHLDEGDRVKKVTFG